MRPLVSVIVPVYHVEAYLTQCIESILVQSYSNIELILVDDGSTDKCPEICDAFLQKDNRVICVHKRNEGQSFARKSGLERASGKYILFVDADDWIEPDTVKCCVETAENTSADVVCFGYKRCYKQRVFKTELFSEKRTFEKGEIRLLRRRMVGLFKDELSAVEAADRLVPMWGKLYKKEVALAGKWISEREVGSSEDAIFNLTALENCNKCIYINRFFYCYRKTNDNATTRKYRGQLVAQWEKLFSYFERYITDNQLGEDFTAALQNRIALSMLGIGLNELESSKNFFQKASWLREVLKKKQWTEAYERLEFKYFPVKWKVFFGLCKFRQTELLLVMLMIIRKLKSILKE